MLRFSFKVVAGAVLGWVLTRTNPRVGILATSSIFLVAQIWAMCVTGPWYLVAFGLHGAGELVGVYAPNYIRVGLATRSVATQHGLRHDADGSGRTGRISLWSNRRQREAGRVDSLWNEQYVPRISPQFPCVRSADSERHPPGGPAVTSQPAARLFCVSTHSRQSARRSMKELHL